MRVFGFKLRSGGWGNRLLETEGWNGITFFRALFITSIELLFITSIEELIITFFEIMFITFKVLFIQVKPCFSLPLKYC